jgi:Flp pilus assembly protein TadD
VFFFKLITAASLLFVIACHSSPKEQPTATEPKVTEHKLLDKPLEEKVVADEPETTITPEVMYLILTAETALQREQYAIALEAYLKVASQVDDVKILEKTAKIAMFLEDLTKTEQAVALWLKKDSENITARRVALTVALSQKNETAAVEHLGAIFKKNPADFSELLLDIQKSLKSDEDVEFSEQLLNRLAHQYPQQSTIFLSQSILAIRQQDFEKAKQKVAQALALQPKWEKAIKLEAELWMYSGKQAFKDKDYAKALLDFKKIKYEKLKLDATMAIISVLFKQNKFNEADVYLDKLLKERPEERKRILLMQAELQNSQENYQQAFDILTQALQESPMDREVLYSRSLMAEKLDDLVTLEADLNKILQQNPNDAAALNALGYSLVEKTTRYEDAEGYLKQALALQPEEAVIIDSYGWLKFKQGDLQAALKYLQEAREKMTGENEITVHLAEVLWNLGQKLEARKLIEDEMKKSPDDSYLLEFKARILDKEIR